MAKITISPEDLFTPQVDQAVAEQRRRSTVNMPPQGPGAPMAKGKASGFRNAMVYMLVFGLVSSLLGWGAGEYFQQKSEKNPLTKFAEIIHILQQYEEKEGRELSDREIEAFFNHIKSQPEYRNNPYLDESLSKTERDRMVESDKKDIQFYNTMWYLCMAICIAIGLAIAESVVEQNWNAVNKNLLLGLILGIVGGLIVANTADALYHALGGGQFNKGLVVQVFARTVGWGFLGLFVALAPGILMRNLKKLLLGLAGGLIGGLIGGLLFDMICRVGGSDVPARFVGIVSFGVLAGLATAILENVAKQGWLLVQAGPLTGKQFILYKNPTHIGSASSSDIFLFKDPRVAATHATISLQGSRYILRNASPNPTMVNGTPVNEQTLRNGDTIQIGTTLFRFETKKVN